MRDIYEEVLNADQLAVVLKVNRQRIYELVRTKKIPVLLLGQRQYRFSKQAVFRQLGLEVEDLRTNGDRQK